MTNDDPPNWQPISLDELKQLGRRIDSEMVSAPHMNGPGGLYEAMHKLGDGWTTLRAPVIVGDMLVMLMVRPRDDEDRSRDVELDDSDDDYVETEEDRKCWDCGHVRPAKVK